MSAVERQAQLLHALAAGVGALPWGVLDGLGRALGDWEYQRKSRECRVARRNLELALPAMPAPEREQLVRAVLQGTARQFLETLRFWTRHPEANLAQVSSVEGQRHFDSALAAGRGLIVSAPHHGNWELLNQWLAVRTPLAILYRPPESAVGEAFLRRVRAGALAGRITQVRAEGPAIRTLFRTLNDGGVVGILPDQQPKAGDGEFAPFFGVPALTMTLLNRLAHRTGAAVLHCWCERAADAPRFTVHVRPASAEVAAADPVQGVMALNRDIEAIARTALSQYQWTYKRYTLRPPGSGGTSPYADFERHSRPPG